MHRYRKIIAIAAVLVAILIVAGTTLAFAQDPDNSYGLAPLFHREGRPDFLDKEALDAAAADALGLSIEEFQAARDEGQRLPEMAEAQDVELETVMAAIQAARAEMIAAAVADGTITQEQADRLLSHPGPRGRHGHRGHGPAGRLLDEATRHAIIAEALGISVEELETALANGQHLPDLAEEYGVDPADVRAALEAARTDAIEQLLADGTITQEQADRLLNGGKWCGPGHGPGEGPAGDPPADAPTDA